MIYFNRGHEPNAEFDSADVAALILTMQQCKDENGDEFVRVYYAEMYNAAVEAAKFLQKNAENIGDDWDGCVWVEYLTDSSPDSLAYRLARDCVRDEQSAETIAKAWHSEYDWGC